jgi:hypothetical protein
MTHARSNKISQQSPKKHNEAFEVVSLFLSTKEKPHEIIDYI